MTMRLLPLFALALSAASAFGQGRKVAFRTLCLDHVKDLTELSLPAAKAGEGAVTVPLFTASTSEVIESTFPSGEAVLYVKGAGGATDKPVIAARAPLAKGDRQLFVLMPGPGGEGKPAYVMRAYDDDLNSFKLGAVRAINLAPVPVRFVVSGATTPQIPADKHAIFPQSTKVDEYNMYPVAVEFLSGNGDWVKGYSASWKASDQRREIVVTLVDGKFKQPVVKIFSDIPPWLQQPAAATP
ncbi:hypothetical protein OKA05_11680 [Luteolibacter arcticus]|uniref:DUF4397 domain-containing protein n=1 Tax=Luteolibacter arcticus TaxID=1581411 RepID=A0ABT3GI80_9BACT|nr:hypothetical protein [Luteolibacter arcticus]MCW1923215.1 hypothetical protein [Luteolibacter arcticus]